MTVVAVGLVVVLLLGVAGLVALGVGPLGGSGDAPPAATPAGPSDGSAQNGSAPGPDHVRPFTLDIRDIQECGRTCRDVTVALTNNGGNPRENVTVTTTIYAGEDAVWEGEEPVGTLDSDETTVRTERVDVGLVGGAKIERNDGRVTIETVVRWDGGSASYHEQRQVA